VEQNARDDYRCAVCGSKASLLLDASGGRELVCVSCPELVKLDQSVADNAPGWFEPRPVCSAEMRLEWFYESLDPEKWLTPTRVLFAREGALWLCGYNPDSGKRNDGTSDPLAGVVETSMTDHYEHLLELFQRVERAEPTVGRTAAQWRDLARAAHFPYDTRVDGLLPAVLAAEEAAERKAARPKLQSQLQEDAVLKAIVALDHSPTLLPKAESGKAGVKAAVRAMLPFSEKVFDKAWERLLKDGRIVYAT
jgi:DNA-directed RNA polymerase subunit RPC12/RpoP